jgi:hypothetical protein
VCKKRIPTRRFNAEQGCAKSPLPSDKRITPGSQLRAAYRRSSRSPAPSVAAHRGDHGLVADLIQDAHPPHAAVLGNLGMLQPWAQSDSRFVASRACSRAVGACRHRPRPAKASVISQPLPALSSPGAVDHIPDLSYLGIQFKLRQVLAFY